MRASRMACVLFSVVCCACHREPVSPSPSAAIEVNEVGRALAHYEALTIAMASDSIAALFTADGVLGAAGQPDIVGPAAIAEHLRSFAGYQVLADTLRADTTRLNNNGARQVGTYWQRVRVPGGDTVEVHGRFEAQWVHLGGASWRLRRLATVR